MERHGYLELQNLRCRGLLLTALVENGVRSSSLMLAFLLVCRCVFGCGVGSGEWVSAVDVDGGVSACCVMERGAPW